MKIGIIGSAGYAGGELLRILVHHPDAEIVFAHSNSNGGNPVWKVHQDLIGSTDLVFTDELTYDHIDVLILCLGHGDAKAFLDKNPVPEQVKVIDLSTDFRHQRPGNDFVYGLPELNKDQICKASNVANPGCFATCIQLGLLPLAAAGKILDEVHTTAITGSTGAGQKLSPTSHFSWRNNNASIYKAFNHQHLEEINQSLAQLQEGYAYPVNFIPFRGDFTRGIIASSYTRWEGSEEEAVSLYEKYYEEAPFTHVIDENPNIKQVVNTNNCLVYPKVYEGKLHVITVIDNLIKGASGQAVENLNLMFGVDPKAGLRLKAAAF